MDPADEDAAVAQLVTSLKAAVAHGIRHVSSTSIEEWMSAKEGRRDGAAFEAAQAELRTLCGVLGMTLSDGPSKVAEAAPFIELLIELPAELRKAKQYQLADVVRNRLADLGVTLEDSAQGTRWKA